MFFYDPRPKDQQTTTLTVEPDRNHRRMCFALTFGWKYNAGSMWGEDIRKEWQAHLDEKFQRDLDAVK